MNNNHVNLLVSNNLGTGKQNKLPRKKALKTTFQYPTCQWCRSSEIRLVPVSSLVNLKAEERKRYSQIWQRQGWPIRFYLCWTCKQNCELAWQGINL